MTETGKPALTGSNGRTDLGLDELAVLHGGLAHFMLEVSERARRCYQACGAKNRRVARHQLGELTKVLKLAVLVRPEYGEAMDRFIAEELEPLRGMISEESWEGLENVWEELTRAVNRYHDEFNHGYLIWQLPPGTASDLDLTPHGE